MSNPKRHAEPSGKICQYFKSKKCRYGLKCRFSHDITQNNHANTRNLKLSVPMFGSSQVDGNIREDRLREWKRLLNHPSPTRIQSHDKCSRFFGLGLELMDGDVGASQETVRLMAKDDGLAFVRALTEHHIPHAITNPLKVDLWLNQVKRLFKLMTHPRAIDSAVLEQEVATVYSFVQGIGGRRMRVVFDFVTGMLTQWPSLLIDVDQDSALAAAELSLAVLSKMIDCSVTNMVDENFRVVLDCFEAFIVATDDSDDEFLKLQAQKYLQYIQRRLNVGKDLPLANAEKRSPVSRADFVMQRDLPGQLSADGPRHDNDHADIAHINILPTLEEISSLRAEYLPTTNTSLFHLPGIRGRLDREFRLLREDAVGQLRDAVRAQLELVRRPSHDKSRSERNNLRTYTYQHAVVQDVSFDKKNGLTLLARFQQPAPRSDRQRRGDWWTQSKRLQPEALVCVIGGNSVLFCVVSDSTIILPASKQDIQEKDDDNPCPDQKPSLADRDDFAYVQLHIAETTASNITQALWWYREVRHSPRRTLVEFPGVLLPAFQHTLHALQRMSQKPNLPFTDIIAPENPVDGGTVNVPPPLYATRRDFVFDLTCLAIDDTSLRTSIREPMTPQSLADHSLLDATQSRALLDTLLRSFALTQGPPGTGKSFTGEKVIQVLLANKQRGNLGPIICVCFTNHALDQLLEHLHKDGVKQIIRIGSRSKSEALENLNLRVVARNVDRTRAEKHSLWQNEKILQGYVPEMEASIRDLRGSQTIGAIQGWLSTYCPMHHDSLFGPGEDGWTTVNNHPDQIIDQWRRGGRADGPEPRDIDTMMELSLESLSRMERARLHNHWLRSIRDPIITRIMKDHKEYVHARDRRDNVRREVDLRCLMEADIIGVTTTGLARNLNLLQRVRCKVMLCEEAGEVLEAHTLTALLPSVEHAILIGDHQQLRPQIQNYDLQSTNPRGAKHSLDVSLFERLVQPNEHKHVRLPFNTLETQRRMHPEISELIRSTLYPTLEDGGSVSKYPNIVGIKKRLFWLHHEVLEDKATQLDPITTSHTNTFELAMTVALVQHLVRQGSYGPNDIAVITPYLGQLHKLRRLMECMFEISVGERDLEELEVLEIESAGSGGRLPTKLSVKTTLLKSIRLATVDNFQGEEAKVIVVSLVRSNEQNRCGFLSTTNRINVLLSRAQHGMYLIGNSKTYRHVPTWANIMAVLEKNDSLGPRLELQCPRHPEAHLSVSQPDHFLQYAPEGGCMLGCDRRLACGHACINRCHSEILHDAVRCLEPCPRPKSGCIHPCRLNCGDPCDLQCIELLQDLDLLLPCGHRTEQAYCWQVQDPSLIICKETVRKTVPGCKHVVSVACNVEVDGQTYKCKALCDDIQPCGHTCRSYCYQCKVREDGEVMISGHGICKQPCGRKHATCRHACNELCHGDKNCLPCPVPCEVRCSHSRCSKLCHEPCPPCAEQTCASKCAHTGCTMPCAAPCDWVPCSKRCESILSCGHQCPSICGERCPTVQYCQVCCTQEVKETMVDFIMASEYADIDLDEDPCIFPDCGHFLTMTSMDGTMDLKAYYSMSAEQHPVELSGKSQPFSVEEIKVCPTCRGSLRSIARYGRIVRRAMIDEATKKFITWSHEEHLKLAQRLLTSQQDLAELSIPVLRPAKVTARPTKLVMANNIRLKQLHVVLSCVGNDRYNTVLKLWHDISDYVSKARKEEQPFQRVANFVQHAVAAHHKGGGTFHFDEGIVQVKSHLQGLVLWLRCEIIIFTDFLKVLKEDMSINLDATLDFSKQRQDCEALIEEAVAATLPRQIVEGHIFFAQFCALTRALETAKDLKEEQEQVGMAVTLEQLKTGATAHLNAARAVTNSYESTKFLEPDIEAVETMLREGVFYAPVSTDEMRAVYQAMAQEFRGTGHWYTCENGHPFTVGECGMPMQQARCPECRGLIGGQNHQAADGVRQATEMENLARGVEGMQV